MTVFKGYLTIIKQNLHIMALYMGIFLAMTIIIQNVMGSEKESSFKATKLNVTVIDRDGGILAKSLAKYIGQQHNLVELPDDKNVLQEELFYRNTEYIITIPEGFEQKGLKEKKPLETTKVPGSYTAVYVDQQVDTFLNNIEVYLEAGFNLEEAIETTLEQGEIKADVTLTDKSGNGGKVPRYVYLFQYLPYLMIAVIGYSISIVLVTFREKEVKRRLQCSSVPLWKQNMASVMAISVLGIVFWMICILVAVILYQKAFFEAPNLAYFLINSLILTLVSLSLAFLVGVVAKDSNVINSIINVISLGMCFLGGVFVPSEMLGKSTAVVAQFLPVHWYTKVNDIIARHSQITFDLKKSIWEGFGIQLIFAIACICVALAIIKYKEYERA